LSTAAGEAVGRGAEVIVTDSSSATRAAKAATSAIPIVMVVGVDPVEYGFVKTLAHPDGNITGIAHSAQFLSAKRLELLKEVLPSLRRVGVLWNGESASQAASLKLTENAAAKLGLKVLPADVRQPRDLPAAFASLSKAGAQALVTVPSAAMAPHYDEILRLAGVHKMPVVSSRPDEPRKGALFSYGSDWQASFRRAAVFVDKILKGAKPADLPVEQPTKLEMVVNLRTARALGIVIPQKVLVRADEVIQ
jgi:putative ABC transport system substrate-binding protein